MTTARSTKGRFLPGNTDWQKASPGRRPLPDDLKGVLKLPPEHVERMLTKMLLWTQEEFQEHMTRPDVSMLEMMVGSVMRKGVIEGDPKYLDFIANKMLWREREEETLPESTVDALKEVPKETLISFLKDRQRA